MYKKQFTAVTIGGPESTIGSAVARTKRFPVTGLSLLQRKASKSDNEVITGRNAKSGMFVDSIDVTAEIPNALRACGAVGMGFAGSLGGDVESPVEVGGAIILKYTGDGVSAKASVSGSDLTLATGFLGEEEADSNFGTAGTLALSGTLSSLLTTIEGYTGYSVEKLFGADSLDVGNPVAVVASQAKGRYAIIFFGESGSGKYLHKFTSNLTNTELPTYSMQFDGSGSNDLGSGGVIDGFSIAADLKGRASVSFNAIFTKGEGGQTSSEVALENVAPMKFANGKTIVSGIEHVYTKSVSADVSNNHDGDEGFGQGSLYKQSHAKGVFSATGSVTLRATTITEAERAKVITNDIGSLQLFFEGGEKEIAIIDMPTVVYTDESKGEGGVAIEQSLSFEAIDQNSYDAMVSVYLVTSDATSY